MSLDSPRPHTTWAYVAGAVALGVSAFVGGGALVADPSGGSLSMPVDLLSGTPFPDFLVPGLVLLLAFGVGSFVTVVGVVRRTSWAWLAAVALGAGQVGWILLEVAFLGEVMALHVVYGLLGLALVVLAATPDTRADLGAGGRSG